MDSRGVNPIKDSLLIAEFYRKYKRLRPDIILHFTIKPNVYGTIAASMLGIPVINNVCGLGTVFLKKNMAARIAMALYRFSFRFPKKIFFQNSEDLDLFLKKSLVRKHICDLLPGSGVNLQQFIPAERGSDKKFTFLLVSRLIYDKGVLEFVEAVSLLKARGVDAHFQVLGPVDERHKRGIPKKMIDAWITDKRIDYLGTTDDVQPVLSQADCVVLPSYREGTPRSLLEAASLGLPLIATNVPGCRSIVHDRYNGYLCASKSATDLADKMEQLFLLSASERRTLGENSRKLVEAQFDERIIINKYSESVNIYSSAYANH
jgi:glycosyltransferase involved in cell wall biosynthesis